MKRFLLIAGDKYYPDVGTEDWIAAFETYEDAKAEVVMISDKTTNAPTYLCSERCMIRGAKYDWFEIVDLDKWTKESI